VGHQCRVQGISFRLRCWPGVTLRKSGSVATKMGDLTHSGSAAVVGSGIAGLACAYLLACEGYDVTMFEKHPEVGMDAHSIMVEGKDGKMMRLNTPPRSFGKGYYPSLMELYRSSGVEVEPWSWAWVAFVVGRYNPFIRVDKSARIFGYALPTYFNWRQPLETIQLLLEGIKFSKAASRDVTDPEIAKLTLGEYLVRLNLSDDYVYKALLPTFAMVCTCSYEACLNYPVGLVLEFYAKTTTYGQYRTRFGTQDAVAKLTTPVRKVNVDVEVKGVWRAGNGGKKARIEYIPSGGDKPVMESFDHIVMATQANHALRIVRDLGKQERDYLESFDHETSQVAIHRDANVMPENEKMWAPMSVGVLPDHDVKKGGSMFTIWMNDSFPDIKGNLFQTWNPVVDIDDSDLVCPKITFERPIMTHKSLRAVTGLAKCQGKGGLWFCGAWNACRIPLQESGVQSAVQVVRRLSGKENLNGGNFVRVETDFEKHHLAENHAVVKNDALYETRLVSVISVPRLIGFAAVATGAVVLFRAVSSRST